MNNNYYTNFLARENMQEWIHLTYLPSGKVKYELIKFCQMGFSLINKKAYICTYIEFIREIL